MAPMLEADLKRWRAAHVDALQLAQVLRVDSRIFRRYAGELKYFPRTGRRGPIGADLMEAAATMRDAVTAIAALAARWDQEVTWLRSVDPNRSPDEIQRGHAATREAIKLLRTALEIFSRTILQPEKTEFDAPYGAGAPHRVHPGAQCTWVAERAESLARELSTVSLLKENLLLAVTRTVGPS